MRRRLERRAHKTRDAALRTRLQIVLLYWRGHGAPTIAAALQCAPATAVRVAQISGSADQPRALMFTWTPSADATGYEWCVSTTPGCPAGNWTFVGAATSTPVAGLAANTQYHWQVRAIVTEGRVEADAGTWWSFRTRPETGDFGANGTSDILWWQSTTGAVYIWAMVGTATPQQLYVAAVPDTTWRIRGIGDVTGDGKADLVWRNLISGQVFLWAMDGSTVLSQTLIGTVGSTYEIASVGDYDGDGRRDLLWRASGSGDLWLWMMAGTTVGETTWLGTVASNYQIDGSGDLDGDGKADLLWRDNQTGDVWIWVMNGTSVREAALAYTVADLGWQIVGIADFDGDGKADLAWRQQNTGDNRLWLMQGKTRRDNGDLPFESVPPPWRIEGTGDYDGDGRADVLWHHPTTGDVWVWWMMGAAVRDKQFFGTVSTEYQIIAPK